jgi:aromatic-amino-acid transaminase
MLHVIPSHQTRPSDDPIFALNNEATSRQQRGESIVNATIGVLLNDDGRLAVLPTAARAVHDVPREEWAAYAPIAGTPAFLRAVMDDLFASAPEMRAAACAVATPGGSGALRHAIANFLEPGHALLTTNYFWAPYQTLADEADRKVTTFPMFDKKGELDLEAFDKALEGVLETQKRALLFLNDPCHNPTGYSMRREEWRGVAERLLAHAERRPGAPITLLVDMAYSAYGTRDLRDVLGELRPLLGKVAVLFAWSASKTYTHYGLRVGALVACSGEGDRERAQTEAALVYSCRGTWSNCTRGGQSAITRLLTDPSLKASCDAEREELKALLLRRVARFNELAPAKKLVYPRYEGGFFVTIFRDDALVKAAAMKEKGVFVVPSKGALRLALCSVAEKDIPRLVDSLAG